jgi:hypothetical protein
MSVAGIFLERDASKNQPVRSFSRVFVIVPFGDGFCIANEQLFVTNATDEQKKVRIYLSQICDQLAVKQCHRSPEVPLMFFSKENCILRC